MAVEQSSLRTLCPLQPNKKQMQETVQTPSLVVHLGGDALGGLFVNKTKKSLARLSSNQTLIPNLELNARNSAKLSSRFFVCFLM